MIIRSKTLAWYRNRLRMSQAALSDATGEQVSLSTIKRIEGHGGEYEANERIVKKLAEALKVQPKDLAREPSDDADAEAKLRELGFRWLKTAIDAETACAFQLVEQQYRISIRSQILMAPLFAALLAEGSLAWRREKLGKIDKAAEMLRDSAEGHLSFAHAVYRVENGARAEEASIAKRDLFGSEVGEDAFELGYDPSNENPFADYLKHFVAQCGTKEIQIDPQELNLWKAQETLPEYRICSSFLEMLTGGDTWAECALMHGYVRIRDIPPDLMADQAASERIKWLAVQVPAEKRAEFEAEPSPVDLGL